jgi:hypothetical protein
MNRDDIIRMAREAGWTGPEENVTYVAMLERFANLVSAAAGWAAPEENATYVAMLERFAHLVAEAEREACAKVCDELVLEHPGRADLTAKQCAFVIRERGAP